MKQLNLFSLSDYEAEELSLYADNTRFIQSCEQLKAAARVIGDSLSAVVDTQCSLFGTLPVPELTDTGWAW